MKKIQVQGVHHTTIVGSTRQSAIDFWEGVLGMPFVLEQPNLGKPDENHLYFDPGDGRLLTVFTNEDDGSAVLSVAIPSARTPELAWRQPVEVVGLEMIPWANPGRRDGEIRSGVAFKAIEIVPVGGHLERAA